MYRWQACVVVLVLMLLPLSCAKVPDVATTPGGDLAIETLPKADSIPSAWGNLVSVTSSAAYAEWLQLWFQDSDGNIRMVPYNIRKNAFSSHVRIVRRGQGGKIQ